MRFQIQLESTRMTELKFDLVSISIEHENRNDSFES